jgi:starch synthase
MPALMGWAAGRWWARATGYEDMFRWAASAQTGGRGIGFDSALAQRVYAGADMLWMPSKFEPCGLAQLIALRYGTIPVVRATGGLADTIKDYDPVAASGNGFRFVEYDPWQFFAAVVRAAETHRHPSLWAWLIRRAMTEVDELGTAPAESTSSHGGHQRATASWVSSAAPVRQ